MYVNPKKYLEIKRKYFNSLTKKQFFEIIRKHQLHFNYETGEVMVFDYFDIAMNYKHIRKLASEFNDTWFEHYSIGMKYDNPFVRDLSLSKILCNDFPIYIPEEEKLISLPAAATKKSSRKNHVEGSPVKQTTIRLYCKDCRKTLSPGKECGHSDARKRYQGRFYTPDGLSSIRRWLDAQNHHEAFIEAHNTRIALEQSGFNSKLVVEHPKQTFTLIKDLVEEYIGFTRNEGVSQYLRTTKNRSKGYINERIKYLGYFLDALKNAGANMERLTPQQLSENIAIKVYEYLDKLICPATGKIYSASSFNKMLGEITSFNIYLIKTKKFKIENHFENLKRKSNTDANPTAISKKEINALLDKMEELKGIDLKQKHFNKFDLQYWLPNMFLFQLATNRRREDLIMAKWSHIYEEEGYEYLKVKDFKISRQKDRDVFVDVLITPELKRVLNAMGYDNYIYTDEYIVFPEIFQRELIKQGVLHHFNGRINLMNKVSRSFPVLYQLSGGKRNLEARSLKKAGITVLSTIMERKELHIRTGHRTPAIVDKHYLDPKQRQELILERRLTIAKSESLPVNPNI